MLASKLLPLLMCRNRIVLQRSVINPNIYLGYFQRKHFSNNKSSAVSKAESGGQVSTDVRPMGEKVKEAAKTMSYTTVILFGVGVTGIIFYFVFRELFSDQSVNGIYSNALERCLQDPDVEFTLGVPLRGYGEETTRRRRNHVSHAFYERDGAKCLRMQFYIQGSKAKATVQLDMKQVNGKFEYRYLMIQLNDYTRKVLVLEDNRASVDLVEIPANQMQPIPGLFSH